MTNQKGCKLILFELADPRREGEPESERRVPAQLQWGAARRRVLFQQVGGKKKIIRIIAIL